MLYLWFDSPWILFESVMQCSQEWAGFVNDDSAFIYVGY